MDYPYYIVPDVEEYKGLDPNSPRARELSRRIAANIGDIAALRLVLGIDPPEFARFYPDMQVTTPTTLDTIDAFLDKFGANHPAPEILQQPEEIEEPETQMPPQATHSEETRPLSSLIRQGLFDKAIELIEAQNLNNTEKSIYFAHQIRFLKKLKAINKYKNQTKG